jgi:hypothetical protein
VKQSIYDLTLQGIEIESLLLDSVGEITPDIQEKMDALLESGPETMESAAAVVTQLMRSAKAAEEEADRLRERAKTFEGQATKLKERMLVALDKCFNGKIKTPRWSIWSQKSADRMVADLPPGFTPEELYKERPDLVRVRMELDRTKVIEEYKAGRPLPEDIWLEEKKGARHVQIR